MSVSKELRAMFSEEQLKELDAVSAAMRADPKALDNHRRTDPVEQQGKK